MVLFQPFSIPSIMWVAPAENLDIEQQKLHDEQNSSLMFHGFMLLYLRNFIRLTGRIICLEITGNVYRKYSEEEKQG